MNLSKSPSRSASQGKLAAPSRSASQGKLAAPSRSTSFVEVNPFSNLKGPVSPPGLSSQTHSSQQVTGHLELQLLDTQVRSRLRRPLTPRDLAILLALDQYRYLDRHQLQTLFFKGPRSCQYRLEWLVRQGLVRTWRVTMRPGFIRRASIYFLSPHGARVLADSCDDDPLPYVQRADHALTRHYHLVHDLQASQFFVELIAASRGLPDKGLYHWVGEHGVRRGYAEEEERGPIPDGWGRFLTADQEIFIHLEWDRGSELAKRLRLKLAAYISYFVDRPGASHNQVLVVVPTEQREEQVARVAFSVMPKSRECCRIWMSTTGRLASAGALGNIWRGVGSTPRIALSFMPGRPRSSRRARRASRSPTQTETPSGRDCTSRAFTSPASPRTRSARHRERSAGAYCWSERLISSSPRTIR